MATDEKNILAGIAGGGDGGSLSWFGETDTTAPTSAISALNAGFKDGGWCDTDGLTASDSVDTTNQGAFGTLQPVRVLKTGETLTFKVTLLETNPISLTVYNYLALDAITVGSDGTFDFEIGDPHRELYSAVFDVLDGVNHIRAYVPNCEVTGKDDVSISNQGVIKYGITLTAYPDSTGLAVHYFYKVPNLGSGS